MNQPMEQRATPRLAVGEERSARQRILRIAAIVSVVLLLLTGAGFTLFMFLASIGMPGG